MFSKLYAWERFNIFDSMTCKKLSALFSSLNYHLLSSHYLLLFTISFSEKVLDLSPTEISSLAGTRVYFNFGLNIEKKYEKIFLESKKELNIVNMSKDIKKLKYEIKSPTLCWVFCYTNIFLI